MNEAQHTTAPEWTVVVNPAAARGRGERALAPALTALEAAGVTPEIVRTTDLEHGSAQARRSGAGGRDRRRDRRRRAGRRARGRGRGNAGMWLDLKT